LAELEELMYAAAADQNILKLAVKLYFAYVLLHELAECRLHQFGFSQDIQSEIAVIFIARACIDAYIANFDPEQRKKLQAAIVLIEGEVNKRAADVLPEGVVYGLAMRFFLRQRLQAGPGYRLSLEDVENFAWQHLGIGLKRKVNAKKLEERYKSFFHAPMTQKSLPNQTLISYIEPSQAIDYSLELKKLWQMQMMFTAYQEILSEYGCQTWKEVNSVKAQMEFGVDPASIIAQANALTELMPDPHRIDIEKDGDRNWLNWFDVRIFDLFDAWGRGCKYPCQHCLRGNATPICRNDPLPVVIKKIMATSGRYLGWYANELFDYCDPFFGVYLDGIIEFINRNKPDYEFYLISKGWGLQDIRSQLTAERIAELPAFNTNQDNFRLSLHLCLSEPGMDIIQAVLEDPRHEVPQWLIDNYARRYANAIFTLKEKAGFLGVYFVSAN
ncbi:MAG: hypothetical protein NTY47_08300, partial [Candidatus Omnitrophica bacterium]|nr:hypothetical protein [Candidatus Omnitrophota bacterium]